MLARAEPAGSDVGAEDDDIDVNDDDDDDDDVLSRLLPAKLQDIGQAGASLLKLKSANSTSL